MKRFLGVFLCQHFALMAPTAMPTVQAEPAAQTTPKSELNQVLAEISRSIEEKGGQKMDALERLTQASRLADDLKSRYSKETMESVAGFFKARTQEVNLGLEVFKSTQCSLDVISRSEKPTTQNIPLTEDAFRMAGAFRVTKTGGANGTTGTFELARGAVAEKATLIEIKLLKVSDSAAGIYIAGQETTSPVEAQAYAPAFGGLMVIAFSPATVYRVSCTNR